MALDKLGWAKLAAIFSGLIFGIYWIPLREMESSGFIGLWSVSVFNLIGLLLILPLLAHRWRQLIPGRTKLHLGTLISGVAFVLYAGAFLYTEVIRVIVLFYLLPIWGFLLARVVAGEKITKIRGLSMFLGLSGLVAICGVDQGIPLPTNAGDWMALSAGILWAFASMLMLTDQDDAINYTLGFLFWSATISIIASFAGTLYGVIPTPIWPELSRVVVWLIPFGIIIIIPAAFATMYGPSQLNPGTVGLLFMTEISVGTITAALLAGEPFGLKEVIGVALITLAGVAEPLYQRIPRSSANKT
ncbi:MAG: EamA family transporter [Gammaproteobacteria bacterium]|nr:EamA family transporter [Gammaproteobacteria bacterium]